MANRKDVKNNTKTGDGSSKKVNGVITAIVAAGIILLIFFIFMFTEALIAGRYSIVNDTSKEIESVRIYFDNSNSEYYQLDIIDEYKTEDIISTRVAAGAEVKGSFDTVPLNSTDAGMVVAVMVDGEEIEYNSGFFNTNFKGRIDIRFYEEDGIVYLAVKASTGLFKSTKETGCDISYVLIDSNEQ